MASRKEALRDVCNCASRKGGKSGKIVFVWRQNFARRGLASRKVSLRDAGPRRAKSLCATFAVLGRANHVCATKFSPSRKQVFLLVCFKSEEERSKSGVDT